MRRAKALDDATVNLIAASCLCQRIQRAGRLVGRRFDEAFRPLGINNWQFSILVALRHESSPTISELAEALGMDRTTLTKSLGPLSRRKLLHVFTDGHDARVRRISLAKAGEEILAQASEGWRRAQQAVTKDIPPEELTQLVSSLERFNRGAKA